jgi:hypothetical protein
MTGVIGLAPTTRLTPSIYRQRDRAPVINSIGAGEVLSGRSRSGRADPLAHALLNAIAGMPV